MVLKTITATTVHTDTRGDPKFTVFNCSNAVSSGNNLSMVIDVVVGMVSLSGGALGGLPQLNSRVGSWHSRSRQ